MVCINTEDMKPMTIKELYDELGKLVRQGEGNRIILMASDDECNEYHHMWFNPELCGEDTYDISDCLPYNITMDDVRKNYVLLG